MRPRRVGEILDAAIKLYVGNARTLMGLAAVVVVPLQALTAIVLLSTIPSGSDVPGSAFSTPTSPSDRTAAIGGQVTLELASLLLSALVTAACVKAVSDAYLDQSPTIAGSLRFALRRLLRVVALQILTLIGLVLAFIALIIPGIWLYAAWSVAVPCLLIERRGAFRSLGRSRRLVKGRWWPSAAVILVSTIMVSVIGGVLSGLLIALASHPSSVVLAVVAVVVAGAISAILTEPFRAAAVTVLYYDLRVRREGYDLEVLADELGLPAASLPVGAAHDGGLAGTPTGEGTPSGTYPVGPESVGEPGGPPYWPPPPGWKPGE